MRAVPYLLALLLLSACARAQRYHVFTTGFTAGEAQSVAPQARIAVLENPDAANPLLEREVAAKVRRALAARGYRTASPGDADVTVRLRYGSSARVQHGEYGKYTPGTVTEVKDANGNVVATVTGASSYTLEPTVSDAEVQWLTMTALDAGTTRTAASPAPPAPAAPALPLWIGEAKGYGTSNDLRTMIDFLIVPTVAAFGRNEPQRHIVLYGGNALVRTVRGQ